MLPSMSIKIPPNAVFPGYECKLLNTNARFLLPLSHANIDTTGNNAHLAVFLPTLGFGWRWRCMWRVEGEVSSQVRGRTEVCGMEE